MLHKITQIFFAMLIAISLILAPVAHASEIMHPGDVIEEESVVFTVEEADALRVRIETLEVIERKAEAFKQLTEIQEREIATLEDLLVVKDAQLGEWQELGELYQDRVDKLERREKFNTLENVGWFVLGVAVTGGAIYLGDKIGDSMETN